MKVSIKQYKGAKSINKSRELDPFQNSDVIVSAIEDILKDPESNIISIKNGVFKYGKIINDKIVIVDEKIRPGIHISKVPIELKTVSLLPSRDTIKRLLTTDEIGEFIVTPIEVGDKKVNILSVSRAIELATGSSKSIKIRRISGNKDVIRFEFEVNGNVFVANGSVKGKNKLPAWSKKWVGDVISSLFTEMKKKISKANNEREFYDTIEKMYNGFMFDGFDYKGITIENVIEMAKIFSLKKDVSSFYSTLKKTVKKFGKQNTIRSVLPELTIDYKFDNDVKKPTGKQIFVKLADTFGLIGETEHLVGYVVFSKGKKTVFTKDVEVFESGECCGKYYYLVTARLGSNFVDTKIIGRIPLTKWEFDNFDESLVPTLMFFVTGKI